MTMNNNHGVKFTVDPIMAALILMHMWEQNPLRYRRLSSVISNNSIDEIGIGKCALREFNIHVDFVPDYTLYQTLNGFFRKFGYSMPHYSNGQIENPFIVETLTALGIMLKDRYAERGNGQFRLPD